MPGTTSAALDGIRVVELGSIIAGPFATRMLADFGAEVIKIEAPGAPDPFRQWGRPRHDGRTLWWSVQSRNKKVVTLDLRKSDGRELFLDLIARSDVLVENMRPGTLERLGIGPEQLWARNPDLIVTRVSGYGQTGPYAHRAGYASVAEAIGGLRHLNGFPGGPPPRSGISLGDSLAALFAVQGTLMALYWRDTRGGHGQVIDISLVDACFSMLEGVVPEYAATGEVRGPSGTGLDGIAPSNVFQAADGKWLIVAANQDTVFARLAEAMGRPELSADPRFACHETRGRHQEEIEGIVAGWVGGRPADEVVRRLDEAGVPCGAIYTVADIFADPLFRQRELLVECPDPTLGPITMPGVVPKLSATPGQIARPGPLEPGADNADVFGRLLHRSDDELHRLADSGVIG